jgi:PIN domain nuclease of toxin-antitoxin system
MLLDTHVLLALIEGRKSGLPDSVDALLKEPDHEHHLSAASLWEIAIKWRLGKLKLAAKLSALPELLLGLGIQIVPINAHHALTAVDPEPATRDPFDRLLLAQCQNEDLKLLTLDRSLLSHRLAVKI